MFHTTDSCTSHVGENGKVGMFPGQESPWKLKGLVHDNAHVSVLTVADCFSTNQKLVRCTQVNLQNSN